jgi:hypothetical protein
MINNKYKVGVGIVTCDREDFLEESLKSFIDNSRDVDYFCLVNDGNTLSKDVVNSFNSLEIDKNLIQHSPQRQSVGKCKNQIMKKCLENKCDFVYLIEDDMILKSPDVFFAYANSMNKSGIFHLNYALHGNANKKQDGSKNARMVVEYGDEIQIGLYPNLVGSFNVFHANILKNVGLYDEYYKNAYEHVDHTYSIILFNLHPPFWYFADLYNSDDYICEIEGSIENSSRNVDKSENETKGFEYFKKKYGIAVNQIPCKLEDEVKKYLNFLKTNYSNKLEI